MQNGLYALASLDGRPLAPRDLSIMTLDRGGVTGSPASGCVLAARDRRASAVHVRSDARGIDVLLGDLDEPADAARVLGLTADTPPLAIVRATIERHGAGAAAHLLGTWLFARWEPAGAALTLFMADRVRDTCYVATDGRVVAVAPDLARLARLGWVDASPDPTGLMLSVGCAPLRGTLGDRTILRDVTRVMPGSRTTVRAGERRVVAADPPRAPAVAASVSFGEAVERLDVILSRMMRQHLEREGDTAVALSGGLDSSLLALYAARERGDRALTFLTSAAPAGSGLPDESRFAGIVACHLSIPIERVAPLPGANVYRPSERTFESNGNPLQSPRHYLDEALEQASLDHGARALLNGYGGEMTVTNHGDRLPSTRPIRDAARAIRRRIRRTDQVDSWPHAAFHIRPSPAALARSAIDPDAIRASIHHDAARLRRDAPLGYDTGLWKTAAHSSAGVDPMLRVQSMLHDRRLLDYAATLPAGFALREGQDRALARALMREGLPRAIVAREKGMAYSPSYHTMIVEQAAAAEQRIPTFRANGLDEWVDLAWVEMMLAQASPEHLINNAFELQNTVIFCEYLLWWNAPERLN